jgi:hypothetical protein
MAYVTITGASGTNIVSTIQFTSAATAALAQAAVAGITSDITKGASQVSLNSSTSALPLIGSIGGTGDTNVGTVTAQNLGNALAFTINNTGQTFASNTGAFGSFANETVISGQGNLNFTDASGSTQIFTGGGNNTITFAAGSSNAAFTGDGNNQLGVNATSGATSVFGTAASSDTVYGGTTASNIVYKSTTGSSALILARSANITVFGGTGGTTTVFGGGGNTTGTVVGSGNLSVSGGTGFFEGGSAGNNIMSSSSIGGTTLVGGGNGDVLSSYGASDSLMGAAGISTLDGSNSVGGDTLSGGQSGASLIYASKTVGDVVYATNSTVAGVGYTGEFIDLHTGPNSLLRSLNASVASTIVGGGASAGSGIEQATIGDFITGLDKLVLISSVVGGVSSISSAIVTNSGGQAISQSIVHTTNGSSFTFYNALVSTSDIIVK